MLSYVVNEKRIQSEMKFRKNAFKTISEPAKR
jgi:hypothetical protein